MSAMQAEFQYRESGQWAVRNPLACDCRGSGYVLSDLDTFHTCPFHKYDGIVHPEHEGEMFAAIGCEEDGFGPEEQEKYWAAKDASRIEVLRGLYREAREAARSEGHKGDFNAECAGLLHDTAFLSRYSIAADAPVSPAMWVAAAEEIAEDAHTERLADDYEAEGPGITEPWEVAYGPRDSGASNWNW